MQERNLGKTYMITNEGQSVNPDYAPPSYFDKFLGAANAAVGLVGKGILTAGAVKTAALGAAGIGAGAVGCMGMRKYCGDSNSFTCRNMRRLCKIGSLGTMKWDDPSKKEEIKRLANQEIYNRINIAPIVENANTIETFIPKNISINRQDENPLRVPNTLPQIPYNSSMVAKTIRKRRTPRFRLIKPRRIKGKMASKKKYSFRRR
jgi:hypothetical protein